ncbi:ABC transporter ATP-binding protein [Rothia uropygioeca]|uniref:ABC transporter ATP-binding protein n=1 Tax=Kocuria sp. 257 TaxID=2021970 RepID=UPI001011B014|nr:ABC transporter ATP-binding protein [Kocuria sp. 257]
MSEHVPKIEIKGLGKEFSTPGQSASTPTITTVLDNIDFSIEQGQFVTLVGPSGSGKTTILDLLAGLTSATTGQILIDGKPLRGPGRNRGVVFQQYALLPWKSARDNVVFVLKNTVDKGSRLKAHDLRVKADRFLRLVGLDGYEDRYPHQLSGGMKQRVAIARALSYEPEILLMDEPFGALDAQTRETLQSELIRIWQDTGTTVLFITHSVEEAVYLGQRVVVLESRPGRVKDVVEVGNHTVEPGRDVRSSETFVRARHEVWSLLHTSASEKPASPEAETEPATAGTR